MARVKNSDNSLVAEEVNSSATILNNEENGKNYDLNELLSIISSMQEEIQNLKANKNNDTKDLKEDTSAKTERLLEILASKKSDKEVTIIHNREMGPGLSTHIGLTGTVIDFHSLGEQRTLSWQQFEECVSKYKKWFDEQIILLAPEHSDLCDKYNIPCSVRGNNHVIVRSDLVKLGKMSIQELEDYYNSLTKEDKAFICSYWLGKCYEKDKNFYDRYKIECLNRLSGEKVFDNVLTVMNNEFSRGN